ncbi:transcription initiation factor IIB [Natronobiforma cellulositropha]|uniref:transcription initiation factor IIB n=1 Tax=Natronobiforma cellulositropha TaxID=1679076 RepID=UPI0021D5A56A|nr:transcription initiation factor IIB family protein [Natronobiforma cellulositropha]
MTGFEKSAICPECEGRLRTIDTELICEECGLVVDTDAIDRGPEWRSFDGSSNRKRTGAPLTRSRHDRGLSTEIGYETSLRLTGRKRQQVARMRREHSRARFESKAARNQMAGFSEIRRIVARLSLPVWTTERSCVLFESAQNADLLRGRSIEGFAAATVYATCRTSAISRTIDEVVAVAHADEAELKAAYRALNRELEIQTGPIDPAEYLPRYASRLELARCVEHRASQYVADLRDAGLIDGKNPSGVAAACLYAAAMRVEESDPITQAAAAETGNVSPVTIRSTFETLRDLKCESH